MDYEFSDIPLKQHGRSLRLNSRFGFRTAYGQLIALVFIPICILAVVGAGIVLSETAKSAKAQQQAQAQAILSRYEPVAKKLARIIHTEKGREQSQKILQAMQVEQQLIRAALVNNEDFPLVTIGNKGEPWPKFDKKRQFVRGLTSSKGHVYGMWIAPTQVGPIWLMVDLDNQPMVIARYRVWLALAVTGLFTLLTLLLCLNIYSKRWIAPIYEMRLHLQHTDHSNLYKPMSVVSSGELNLLQRDMVFLLRRLHVSFQELKEYAEQTEDDLRSAFDEMELQTISIRGARDAAVLASEAKSAFLANISHELRTPLNSIDGFINLLARKQDLTSEQNIYVQTIRKSSAHLLALVNDVLDFSKIEAGKLVLERQEVDLYAVIYDVVDMLTPLAAEKNIDLAVFYYDDVPTWIIADELRCKQVLTNLVSNALKFTDAGEVIVRVSLAEAELSGSTQKSISKRQLETEQIRISVQDTGKGIATDARNNLFKSFSQADPSITRQYGGTGLGLVISKQLVQLMGGDIGYQDNATENIAHAGSTFWFSVPVTKQLEQPATQTLPSPLHVLVYLEHETSMKVLMGLLANMGANVTKAASTAGLLDKLKKSEYDWVIIDGNEDLAALLRGIRENYQGKLLAFAYQVALDYDVLETYQAQALYQPINRRSLMQLFTQTKEEAQPAQTQWQQKHVLAVDDHMPNLMVLDALLSELGVSVTTVNSGYDAIDTFNRKNLANNPFDLIFMDIQMPRMSGFEAAQQIRALEQKNQHTPIIALTAHALADEREKLLSAGVDDYVSKPISHPQLVSVLKKWFDGVRTSIERDIAVEGLSVLTPSFGRLKTVPNMLEEEQKTLTDLIDWQDALARSANKATLAKDILDMLIASLPKEKAELQAAWEMSDINAIGQIAHRINGGTRYTGVPALRSAVQRFDQQVIAQADTAPEKAKSILAASYLDLIKAIDQLIQADLSQWKELAELTESEDEEG